MKKKTKMLEGSVTISFSGRPLKINMEAPEKPVNSRRMLPVFRKITNKVVDFSTELATETGKEVSCQAGCGACCKQPVPISITEAHAIRHLVESMPTGRRNEIEERFAVINVRLSDVKWYERLESIPRKESEERRKLAIEYFELGMDCPFLEKGSCSIYEDRPMACREYLVVSPAENCSNPKPETIEMVDVPIAPSYIFRKITNPGGENAVDNYLPLVAALQFSKSETESSIKHTGEKWLSMFFKSLAESGAGAKPGAASDDR